jgi:hypothetical protein
MAPFMLCTGTCVIIWKCFDIANKLSKQPFKRALANTIVTSSLFTLGKHLPRFCITIFEALFTENLWSIRGFIRSCVASIVVVAILTIVWYSSIPIEWHLRIAALRNAQVPNASTWCLIGVHGYGIDIGPNGDLHVNPHEAFTEGNRYTEALSITRLDTFIVLPILYNFVADFAALIFTQAVINSIIDSGHTVHRLFIILFSSACLLLALSFVVLHGAVTVMDYIVRAVSRGPISAPQSGGISEFGNFSKAILFPFYKRYPNNWNVGTLYGVFVWSTLIGILWIGIFITSVIIANLSMKLKGVGPWLDRNFHVRREPFRILAVLTIISVFMCCAIYHSVV